MVENKTSRRLSESSRSRGIPRGFGGFGVLIRPYAAKPRPSGSRPKSASRTMVSMSLRLTISRQVALQHRLLPLRQPRVS